MNGSSMSSQSEAVLENNLIKRLSENATIPVRGSPFSAGYDLFRFFSFKYQFII